MLREILKETFFNEKGKFNNSENKKNVILYRFDYKKAPIRNTEDLVKKKYLLKVKEKTENKEFFISDNCYGIKVNENNLDEILKFSNVYDKELLEKVKLELREKNFFVIELSKRKEKIKIDDYIVRHFSPMSNTNYYVHYDEKEFIKTYIEN